MNMAHCRFRNTLQDLVDCEDHILDDDLSKEEQRARKQLIETCQEIVANGMSLEDDDLEEE
jgi:nucleoid-associated protein YejK